MVFLNIEVNHADARSLRPAYQCILNWYVLIFVCLVGHLFSWGCNSTGQLGIGLPLISNTDVSVGGGRAVSSPLVHSVDSVRGVAIAHIAAGSQHSTALSISGALFTWGFNR